MKRRGESSSLSIVSQAFLHNVLDVEEQELCWNYLARLFYDHKKLNAAGEVASRGVGLLLEKVQGFWPTKF